MALSLRSGLFGNYWGNDYNSSNALNMEQMKINATYLWLALREEGWSLNAVAGVLGNMQSESSINPGRWQSDIVEPIDPTYAGYGLVQWTPYTKYTNWATGDPSTMDNNISRILYEVANEIQWIPTEEFNYSFEEFTHSEDTPTNLAKAFIKNYERPQDPDQPIRRNAS